MNGLDWAIMGLYIAVLLWISFRIGKSQTDEVDYYLGSKKIHWFPVGVSTMATQLSTNSMLGAPAFVAFSLGGGLLWLQYELAVPLAMIFIMIFLVPFFKRSGVISIYEYLELRLGPVTRLLLSVLFQFILAFGTGVTVYGISIVLQVCLGMPFWLAVMLLGVVTVIYDALGGIKSVIVSDVLQMAILLLGIVVAGAYAISYSGGLTGVIQNFDPQRMKALDLSGTGLGDGATFAFLPMLFGGLFLYISYYGCNQTQVQRHLSTKNIDDTNMALTMNGIFRFPVVVGYCLLGVAIGAFATIHPHFLTSLPTREVLQDGVTQQLPNYNAAVPIFVLSYLPHGVIGIIIVALFAAAMSSLDSTLNSLSAITVRDIFDRYFPGKNPRTPKQSLLLSKLITVFWGFACVGFSFFVGNISDSIIVSINKIGSLANGPILAAFLLAILTKRANDWGTVIGIIAGFVVNLYLWVAAPGVSWLWWNVIGCVVTFGVGYLSSYGFAPPAPEKLVNHIWRKDIGKEYFKYTKNWNIYYGILIAWFLVILAIIALV